jgi:DNA-binding CsgD family transcriptional regulator
VDQPERGEEEGEVLKRYAAGASAAEIAAEIYLSYGTVRNYLASAVTKLGARNRVDAARIANEAGWLQTDAPARTDGVVREHDLGDRRRDLPDTAGPPLRVRQGHPRWRAPSADATLMLDHASREEVPMPVCCPVALW